MKIVLTGFGETAGSDPYIGDRCMAFHVHGLLRRELRIAGTLFRTTGNLVIPDFMAARVLAASIAASPHAALSPPGTITAGRLNAMGLVDEILHLVFRLYREKVLADALPRAARAVAAEIGGKALDALLEDFTARFPPRDVYAGVLSAEDWLAASKAAPDGSTSVPNRDLALEELILVGLANENRAFSPFRFLFDDGNRPNAALAGSMAADTAYRAAFSALEKAFMGLPGHGPDGADLLTLLRAPAKASPDSLEGQLRWMMKNWGAVFQGIDERLLGGLDLIAEEERPHFPPGPGPAKAYDYTSARHEYERFTPDRDWMPRAVMIAKSTLVWLHQLSVRYGREIVRLDQVPDEELDTLAGRGINTLWLIGLWERSGASERIKKYCGNPEAASSAYSLFDYEIAGELGGWEALERLRERCLWRGIRLAADMVPNHTGLDSAWVRDRPDLFIGTDHCPFPGYTWNGADLSGDPGIGLWLEDHYYSRSDAAVVFKRLDRRTGHVRYLYHGNDGTGMAWNDTAQIDFLNPAAREAVKERILHVARNFSVIRFDAAMVLAKQHIRRLWYPAPGSGGAVPSRAGYAMTDAAFDKAIPEEFWREVVDMCAREAPDTLLLAEAFWMMEGYFVRTLGMHRVYNSAFMNMLKAEKNSLYRLTIRNTQEFDREILRRFVNFMSNPDEDTANAQFGSGDKYFGVCTLMATMPGLPMFGHGQVEGFTEKYGMEYRKAYREETPDPAFVARHEREIFPLLRMRHLFAGVEHFHLYDFLRDTGGVDENVFAYSNGRGEERTLVFYNNAWERTCGHVSHSCPWAEKTEGGAKRVRTESLVAALDLDPSPDSYLIAREQRSGLGYVFSARDLQLRGWHVELLGYQSLVFVDFERVKDTDGRYRRLHAALNGAGVPDLDEALEEAAHPELYHALDMAIAATLDAAPGIHPEAGADRATAGGLVGAAAAGGLMGAATASAMADGLVGAMAGDGTSKASARAGDEARTARAIAEAETFFGRLAQELSMECGSDGVPGIQSAEAAKAAFAGGFATLDSAAAGFFAVALQDADAGGGRPLALQPEVVSVLVSRRASDAAAAYVFTSAVAMLSGMANQSEGLRYLAAKFLIAKKLSKALEARPGEAGPVDALPRRAAVASRIDGHAWAQVLLAFAARPPMGFSVPSGKVDDLGSYVQPEPLRPRERAVELLRWVLSDDEARAALGVNPWDGVEYFNKERMEALLAMAPLFAAIETAAVAARDSRTADPSLVKDAAFTALLAGNLVSEVLDLSGYRMDRLIALVDPESAVAAPQGGPGTAAGTTAAERGAKA